MSVLPEQEEDPTEVAVFIIKGERDGKYTPIAKLDTGKIVLFPGDYHQYIKPGEVWICRIIKDEPTYCMAYPKNKVMGVSEAHTWKPMPPVVSQLFVEKMEEELVERRRELEVHVEKMNTLKDEFEEIERKYREAEGFLSDAEEVKTELESEISTIQEALDHYTPQTTGVDATQINGEAYDTSEAPED